MAYTSADLVGQIVKVTAGDDLSPFLAFADAVVADNCLKSGYDDEKLELIERYVAAHAYVVFRRRRLFESASGGGAGITQRLDDFQKGLYFNNTLYGQQAVILDYKGNLASLQKNLEKGGKAVVKYVGTNFSRRWWC